MGVMTLADFRAELLFNLKSRNDSGVTSTTRQDLWINTAYRHLTHPSVFRFHEVESQFDFTLVTGTNSYSLAQATVGFFVVAVRQIIYYAATTIAATTRKRKLRPRSQRWFDERTLSSGEPGVYTIDGGNLIISAVPRSNENGNRLRAKVWREPTALAATSDVTVLPSYWDWAMVKGSQWIAEASLGYKEIAEQTKQDYVGIINEVVPAESIEAEDSGQQAEIVVNPVAGPMQ